jgi:A/G-specific adenine glycosylase
LKLWEGLGYYSRCKNLIATARYISTELQGVFPDSFENIIKLKGIGPYTAAAIASFAFQKPHAVVDGNVMRILARYFCIESTLHSTKGKKVFNEIAQILLDKKQPAIYNQAIMDFGATVCKPQIPSCEKCMLALHCEAFNKNRVAQFPIKHKKPEKKKRWFFYVIIEHNKQYYVQIRDKKDIWQELAEFYLIEKTKNYSIDQILKTDDFFTKIKNLYTVTSMSEQYIQHLSHQTIYCTFIHINLSQKKTFGSGTFMNLAQLKKIAFPKTITSYFSETSFFNVGK